jgi:DNA-binding MarR family transcriptional regulator
MKAMHIPGLKVTPTGIFVLTEAIRRGPVHVTELNRVCFGELRRIHSHLYPLEHAGYVTWSRERVKGASGVVEITGKGRELLGALERIAEGV